MDLPAVISPHLMATGVVFTGAASLPVALAAMAVEPARLGAFVVMTTGFSIVPGPAVLFSVATGMAHGRRAGLSGVAGICAGSALWFIGAALGLGTLINRWPLAFHVMAWLGVIYIFWLGTRSFHAAWKGEADIARAQPAGRNIAFRDGLVVQIFNPKALLFFVAVLPPFLDPSAPAIGQFIVLGTVAIGIDLLVLSVYAAAGGALGAHLHNPAFRRGFMVLVGLLLIGSGCLVATRIPA